MERVVTHILAQGLVNAPHAYDIKPKDGPLSVGLVVECFFSLYNDRPPGWNAGGPVHLPEFMRLILLMLVFGQYNGQREHFPAPFRIHRNEFPGYIHATNSLATAL
jgi:hypothetical protein